MVWFLLMFKIYYYYYYYYHYYYYHYYYHHHYYYYYYYYYYTRFVKDNYDPEDTQTVQRLKKDLVIRFILDKLEMEAKAMEEFNDSKKRKGGGAKEREGKRKR